MTSHLRFSALVEAGGEKFDTVDAENPHAILPIEGTVGVFGGEIETVRWVKVQFY